MVTRSSPLSPSDFHVFHAGTAWGGENGKEIITAGGRVLCITALADGVRMAQRRAYEIAEHIHFDGMQFRTDIGWRALKRRA